MEFKELIEKRRSIRKFSERAVPREIVDRILHETLSAPSARNTRTTRLVVVDDPALVARMADMRDYGSAFMKGAPLAIVVLGDTTKSDLWRENAAISARCCSSPAWTRDSAPGCISTAGAPQG
ncbi:MAG: nitroreductase family protein [Alistipes finegoldii]